MSLRVVEPIASADAVKHQRGLARPGPSTEQLERLPRLTWTVMHDVRWPSRPDQLIDHVVVGPAGIFVIDLRHWDGPIQLDDGILRAEGRPREREVAEAADAAADVASVLDRVDPHWVVPVICLPREESVAGVTRGVVYTSSSLLEQMILSRREVISADRARFTAQLLQVKLHRDPHRTLLEPDPLVVPPARPRRRRRLPKEMVTIAARAAIFGAGVALIVGEPTLIARAADALTSALTVR